MANTSWKTIAADIVRLIDAGDLAIGARIPSGEELATQWGVSRHTAHRAIEELQRQGIVVRQRRWGTTVADRREVKLERVGFLVDHFARSYNFPSGDLIRGMQDELGEDVQLVIAESKDDCETEVRQLMKFQGQVSGLIVYPTSDPRSRTAIQRVADSALPTVILDRLPEGVRADAVMSDNVGATLTALRLLQERGHRRIGFFSFYKPNFSTVTERHAAYQKVMAEIGIEDTSALTRWFPRELDDNPQGFAQAIYDSLFTLLNQSEPITALFCVQDSLAASTLQACDQMRICVPDQLEMATFNDWPPMMLQKPWCMHRIVPRSYDIGRSAASLLLERLNGGRTEPKVLRLPADFIVAETGPRPIPVSS